MLTYPLRTATIESPPQVALPRYEESGLPFAMGQHRWFVGQWRLAVLQERWPQVKVGAFEIGALGTRKAYQETHGNARGLGYSRLPVKAQNKDSRVWDFDIFNTTIKNVFLNTFDHCLALHTPLLIARHA